MAPQFKTVFGVQFTETILEAGTQEPCHFWQRETRALDLPQTSVIIALAALAGGQQAGTYLDRLPENELCLEERLE